MIIEFDMPDQWVDDARAAITKDAQDFVKEFKEPEKVNIQLLPQCHSPLYGWHFIVHVNVESTEACAATWRERFTDKYKEENMYVRRVIVRAVPTAATTTSRDNVRPQREWILS